MLSVIDEKKALSYISEYYNLLAKTGYAKHSITQWYLFYLFIIDFYNWLFPYFTDKDYNDMDMALVSLFNRLGNCIVPSQVWSTDTLKIARHVGLAHYTGPTALRKTSQLGKLRAVDENSLRRIE